ncbi:tripartite tricarboxylate transporter permease [Nocardiopsis oceani]
MLAEILAGFSTVFQWPNILIVLGAVAIAFIIGVLPGLGGAVALALLIPLTFGMSPEAAIILLMGVAGAVCYSGMITSIVLNTPGTPENAATVIDGYPLAKQGRATEAIGAGIGASVLGGLIGIGFLILLVPVARELVLNFSYPEYLMMAVFALTVIAMLTQGRAWRGLLAAGVGFMLSVIGLEPITGSPRFTFGETYLWDGIPEVPALIGLFAGAEMLALYGRGKAVSEVPSGTTASTFGTGVRAALRHWSLVLRGGLIGTGIGVVPGVGGVVASFLSYGQAVQTSKHPERFGKGAIEGVVAAESANDAKDGGSLLPTVAFGIPSSVTMAMLLGALVMHGVPAGPTLMLERTDLIYVMIAVLVVAKLAAPVFVWLIGPRIAKLTQVRPSLLAPAVVVIALSGAFALNGDIYDVFVVLVFSYLGYGMQRYGFSRIAFVIALLLGELVERSYHQTVASFGDITGIVTRPISLVLVIMTLLMLAVPLVKRLRSRSTDKGGRPAAQTGNPSGDIVHGPGTVVFDGVLILFIGALVWSALAHVEGAARLVPLIIGVPTLLGLAVLLVLDLAKARGRSGDTEQAEVLRRELKFAAWAVSLVVVAVPFGLYLTIPVAVFALLKFVNREGWLLSAAMAFGLGLFSYTVFEVLLGLSL